MSRESRPRQIHPLGQMPITKRKSAVEQPAHGSKSTAMTCSPCVARLQSAQQRLEALRQGLREEPDPLVAITHLLHLCREEHRLLWEQATDPRLLADTASMLEPVRAIAASRPARAGIDAPMREALATALAPLPTVAPALIARALAQFLDGHYADFIADSFRRRSPYQPAVGDPIPLGGPDIRAVIDMRATTPPWRLANRLDETRRIRLAGEWATQFRVIFDYGLFDALAGLVTRDTIIATCHPNRVLAEFTLPKDPSEAAFPVRPARVRRQRRILDRLIGSAVQAGASIVVLPELSVTESLSRALRQWVRSPDGPRVLVSGSFHHADGRPPRRRNTTIAWIRDQSDPLVHEKLAPAEHPIPEDIRPQGWPEIRVYVTADGWHLVLAICRDLLNPNAVHTLAEVGANLVLAPAMSESLTPFTGQIAHLVGSGQALVAVANNPADWSAAGQPHEHHATARALFGHPGLGQQTRLVTSTDSASGVATMHVRSAQVEWIRDDSQDGLNQQPDRGKPVTPIPPWADSLTRALSRRRPWPTDDQSHPPRLRPAAVLVLLTDGFTGPRVLLTQRSADLRDYPGQLAFPGGASEPTDDGPVSTALREATEEVGLDTDHLHLLGVLPAMTDSDSKFLITPVIAWSHRLHHTRPINVAEVDSVHQVGLHDVDTASLAIRLVQDSPRRLGGLTATIIDLLVALLESGDNDEERG